MAYCPLTSARLRQCVSCNQVHVPNQRGPTDEGLQKIEAIRARDHEVYLERKAKKAKQRAKARAIPPKEDSDEERVVVASAGKPFGVRAHLLAKMKPADFTDRYADPQ